MLSPGPFSASFVLSVTLEKIGKKEKNFLKIHQHISGGEGAFFLLGICNPGEAQMALTFTTISFITGHFMESPAL